MRLTVVFLFAGILASSCGTVGQLNANSKEIFCRGAQNMMSYIQMNNKLPRDKDSLLSIVPESEIIYGVPPEFKSKLLNKEMTLSKNRKFIRFQLDCVSRLEIKGHDLSRYYYDYDSAAKIIALVVVKRNENYNKDEWIYFYGLLGSRGEIMKQDEFHFIDHNAK